MTTEAAKAQVIRAVELREGQYQMSLEALLVIMPREWRREQKTGYDDLYSPEMVNVVMTAVNELLAEGRLEFCASSQREGVGPWDFCVRLKK